MRRLFIIMGVTFLLLGCIGAYFAFVQKPWALFCPGIQTNDLDHLDGTLRKKVDKIMKTLDAEGFSYEIGSTYRSPEKQQCYYEISQVIKTYTGQNGLTRTKNSCHNKQHKGKPSSMAIDLHSYHGSTKDQAQFYLRLRELAKKYDLESGGSWKPNNPIWAKYGLGWDPGHLQLKSCK